MKKNNRLQRKILDVNIDVTSKAQVLKIVSKFLIHQTSFINHFFITTPNPEIVLASQKDKILKEIINKSDLAICDGVGLSLASRVLYGKPIKVIKGRELFLDLLKLANEKKLKVFLLGSTKQVIEKCLAKISCEYPNAEAQGNPGPKLDVSGKVIKIQSYKDTKLQNFKPDILFVAFGAPKQEKWIANNIKDINAAVIMTVGGTLDYYSGIKPQPPKILSNLGLEWLWRLISDPKRYKRILNATFIFPILVTKEKFFKH